MRTLSITLLLQRLPTEEIKECFHRVRIKTGRGFYPGPLFYFKLKIKKKKEHTFKTPDLLHKARKRVVHRFLFFIVFCSLYPVSLFTSLHYHSSPVRFHPSRFTFHLYRFTLLHYLLFILPVSRFTVFSNSSFFPPHVIKSTTVVALAVKAYFSGLTSAL
jgi:hypothetical protein